MAAEESHTSPTGCDSVEVDAAWLLARDSFVDRLREYRLPLGALDKKEIAERSRAVVESTFQSLTIRHNDAEAAEAAALFRVCWILIEQFNDEVGWDLYWQCVRLWMAQCPDGPVCLADRSPVTILNSPDAPAVADSPVGHDARYSRCPPDTPPSARDEVAPAIEGEAPYALPLGGEGGYLPFNRV